MQYVKLGDTGLEVSRLCFGAMTLGIAKGMENVAGLDQKDADTLVGKTLDAGINFFDTANVYSLGQSETFLGKALANKRQDVVIATKVFGRMRSGPNNAGLSRSHIMQEVGASLQRLGTDYIDLYQIHGFHPSTPLEETLRALDDLVRQGKVRYIGCSNLFAWQVMKALGVSAQQNLEKFVSMQVYYSLAGRDLELELVPFAQDQKLAIITWSPLAGGFLSGKFTRNGTKPEGARRSAMDFPPIDMENIYNIVEVLEKVSARHHATVAQIALAWQLHKSYVTSVIIGARSENQLNDNLGAVKINLSTQDVEEIEAVSKPPLIYPAWMQPFMLARNKL